MKRIGAGMGCGLGNMQLCWLCTVMDDKSASVAAAAAHQPASSGRGRRMNHEMRQPDAMSKEMHGPAQKGNEMKRRGSLGFRKIRQAGRQAGRQAKDGKVDGNVVAPNGMVWKRSMESTKEPACGSILVDARERS
ncbi:hypothetical protein AXG93_154s1480 [Marchantia polymorpha subsp. ruderalis]|uniref:Uncharacterized protein n=1 Tax=Marchantia polymorpha subsp. ruderalis TaxID=1480154 RepID=A0A176VID6_MARPO|nr:hypothetical protein AXG93_154s1480 [Marchantia polymorpha subsp. ruderalis]